MSRLSRETRSAGHKQVKSRYKIKQKLIDTRISSNKCNVIINQTYFSGIYNGFWMVLVTKLRIMKFSLKT